MHTFPEHESEHWIKPSSEFFFDFDINMKNEDDIHHNIMNKI